MGNVEAIAAARAALQRNVVLRDRQAQIEIDTGRGKQGVIARNQPGPDRLVMRTPTQAFDPAPVLAALPPQGSSQRTDSLRRILATMPATQGEAMTAPGQIIDEGMRQKAMADWERRVLAALSDAGY